MKPHPRIRKTIKWGGAVVTAAVLIAYGASVFVSIDWMGERWGSLNVCQGMIHAATFDRFPRANAGWLFTTQKGRDRRIVFSFECAATPAGWCLFVPLGVPLVGAAIPTVFAWWLDRRARRTLQGLCEACGYDRTGLAVGAVCPECGRLPA